MIKVSNTLTGHFAEFDIAEISYSDYPKLTQYTQDVALAFFHDRPQNRVRGHIDWFRTFTRNNARIIGACAEAVGGRATSREFSIVLTFE